MAVINKTSKHSQPSSSQGPSKQPQVGRDTVDDQNHLRSKMKMTTKMNRLKSFHTLPSRSSNHAGKNAFLQLKINLENTRR